MTFNSLHFVVFLPVVIALHHAIPSRWRWLLLLTASYYFYMSWRIGYAALIVVSTLVDYHVALRMEACAAPPARRRLLSAGIAINLGLLFSFKYYNFFGSNLSRSLEFLGSSWKLPALDVLLPVGISFYTFQTMSYTIDVYRGERPAERRLGVFALYVAFFPQLVAGPIERSTRLLPQFLEERRFDPREMVRGAELVLWGMFKKVAIADRLALYVDQIYGNPASYHGAPVVLATYFFAFQIYCDFSGYTDIAIGAARMLGYDLMVNFRHPYFAESIGEFWRRWHISLSSWFRDYVYVPLGGNRVAPARWCANIMCVFVLSGLWHGANWTFLVWGVLHGTYLLFARWTGPVRRRLAQKVGLSRFPVIHRFARIAVTFHLVLAGWVLFRADGLGDALLIFRQMALLDPSGWHVNVLLPSGGRWQVADLGRFELLVSVSAILLLVSVELLQRRGVIEVVAPAGPRLLRWGTWYALLLALVLIGSFGGTEFLYFQF